MEARARLHPDDVGFAANGRRRVPGLRREEVAELAQISPAWYTLLETARDIRVSPRMLDRLAGALRLTDEEKIRLFSLAIDELPAIPAATPDSIGAIGRDYFELKTFARRARSVSNIKELAELTADHLFDCMRPVEDAYFVTADLAARQFTFVTQRLDSQYRNPPPTTLNFTSVPDSREVLVEGGLFATTDAAETANAFFDRARQLGAGRFISDGIHAGMFDGAIGYFQSGNEPHSEPERERLGLIAEIVYFALAARV